MAMTPHGRLQIDDNDKPVMGGTSSVDNATVINSAFDPITRRLLVDNANTSASLVVGTTTITGGTDTRILYDNAGLLGEYQITGSGKVVMDTSPTLVTPVLGVATVTSINTVAISGSSTPTLAVTGTTTVSGANTGDQTSVSGNAGTATALQNARTIGGTSFNGTTNIAIGALNSTNVGATTSSELLGVISDETGTGKLVFASKPTFIGTVQTVSAVAAQAFDGSAGSVFTRTLAGSETFTQSNFTAGQCFMVEVKQGSGTTYTVTWWAGVTWVTSGATAPVQTTTTNGITTYGFRCTGSNTFLGYLVGTQ